MKNNRRLPEASKVLPSKSFVREFFLLLRARDSFVMENKPSLEEEWTDRIFSAFTKRKQTQLTRKKENAANTERSLELCSEDQKENPASFSSSEITLEDKNQAKMLIDKLFEDSVKNIRVEDIPFQDWSCSDIVMFLLQDVEDEVK